MSIHPISGDGVFPDLFGDISLFVFNIAEFSGVGILYSQLCMCANLRSIRREKVEVMVSWDEVAVPCILVSMFTLCEIIVLWSSLVILMVSNLYCLFVIDLHTDMLVIR